MKIDRKVVAQSLISPLLATQVALVYFFGETGFRLLGHRKKTASNIATVLVVRLDEIGDMVLCTPFLRELRHTLPQARITLVVKPGVRPLFEFCPLVDEVLAFDFNYRQPGMLRPFTLPWQTLRFAARHLWRQRYDLALLPRWDTDYYYATFLAYWSGARQRVGFTEKATAKKRWANRGFDRLLTLAVPDEARRHETERPLLLLKALELPTGAVSATELWVDDADRAFAEELLREAGVTPGEPLIGIGPAGGHSVLKQWPLENFALLGRRLQQEHGATLVLFGGPDEALLGQSLAGEIGAGLVNAVGRTSLRQMAALMVHCQVYIGNDSGPSHVAAAMGTPVVVIFGSSCPHRFRPAGNTTLIWHELPCSPCRTMNHEERCVRCIFDEPRCLTGITVEEVLVAVESRLLAPRLSIQESV